MYYHTTPIHQFSTDISTTEVQVTTSNLRLLSNSPFLLPIFHPFLVSSDLGVCVTPECSCLTLNVVKTYGDWNQHIAGSLRLGKYCLESFPHMDRVLNLFEVLLGRSPSTLSTSGSTTEYVLHQVVASLYIFHRLPTTK